MLLVFSSHCVGPFSFWIHLGLGTEEWGSPFSFYQQTPYVIFRPFIIAAALQCMYHKADLFFKALTAVFIAVCSFCNCKENESSIWFSFSFTKLATCELWFATWQHCLLFILIHFVNYNKHCACDACMRRPEPTGTDKCIHNLQVTTICEMLLPPFAICI